MNLYPYCITETARHETVHDTVGLWGTQPAFLTYQDISILISEAQSKSVPVTRENVLTHERVISRVLAETTPLPFRFGIVIARTELDSYIETNRASLRAALDLVRGAVEMSIRVIATEGQSARRLDSEAIEVSGQGAAFLEKKRRQFAEAELSEEQSKEIACWLEEKLGSISRKSVHSVAPGGRIFSAAYLIGREQLPEYSSRVKMAVSERKDLRILTSGPWPPYSFCATSL